MPSERTASINGRRKYLELTMPRCHNSRGSLLSEMGKVTGLYLKNLTQMRSLPRLTQPPSKPRYKEKKYEPDVENVIQVAWESLDYICAERITPASLTSTTFIVRFEPKQLSL